MLVSFEPVLAPPAISFQRYMHTVCVFHFFDNNFFYTFFFFNGNTEVQFVMYLQDHFRPDAFLGEAAVDADHCHFDDVGFASLYRCVDSVALGKSPNGVVARGDVRQVAATMEDGLSITLPRWLFPSVEPARRP